MHFQRRFLFLVFLLFEIIGVSLNQWNSPKGTAPAQPTACPANQSPPANPQPSFFAPPLSFFFSLFLFSLSSSLTFSLLQKSIVPFLYSSLSSFLNLPPAPFLPLFHHPLPSPFIDRFSPLSSFDLHFRLYWRRKIISCVCVFVRARLLGTYYKEPILLTSPKDLCL